MIDLNHDPNILFYYVKAVSEASASVSTSKELAVAEDLIYLVTGLINDDKVESILERLKSLFKANQFHTQERDFALATLISAFDYKQQILNDTAEPIALKYILIPSPVKTLPVSSDRFKYEFSLDVNAFLEEQLLIEEKFQKIIKSVLAFEQDLFEKRYHLVEEKYFLLRKSDVLEKALSIIQDFKDKKITLPKLYKKLFRQYDRASLIPHDTYGSAFMGFFGKSTTLAQMLWDFDIAVTKKIVDLNAAVNRSEKCSFAPVNKVRRLNPKVG